MMKQVSAMMMKASSSNDKDNMKMTAVEVMITIFSDDIDEETSGKDEYNSSRSDDEDDCSHSSDDKDGRSTDDEDDKSCSVDEYDSSSSVFLGLDIEIIVHIKTSFHFFQCFKSNIKPLLVTVQTISNWLPWSHF